MPRQRRRNFEASSKIGYYGRRSIGGRMEDQPSPETPKRTGFFARVQPIMTTVLAVAAIGLAAWEGLENRRHNRLSVAPRLNSNIGVSSEQVSMSVESSGLGPAVVEAFRIYLDGKVVHDAGAAKAGQSPWETLMPAFSPKGYSVAAYAFGVGNVLRAGQDYELFRAALRDTANTRPDTLNLSALLDRLGVEICYCSIYGDQCHRAFIGLHDPGGEGCKR
jgi:hypothetical protein